jgi:hypothetical protein
LFSVLIACVPANEDTYTAESPATPKFLEHDPRETGITFANNLVHTERLNTYTYRNFYNGAGVAAGDVNNDGLVDLYFAGNQENNKLYLNRGNFVFEDVTEQAGLACPDVWSTGVSMADVNGDGWLDIYVCKSGPPNTPNRNNELFINNGDLTFTEMSAEYGIDDKGLSNHAAFFDFDRDGDLDMYLLNNSLRSIGIYDLREGQRDIRDPEGGNKLYRNDGDRFTDVSEQAGIYGSAIGFGLGVTVSDVNRDQWPDIFVSNDFFERDYLYINNQDGTFSEVLTEVMNEISMGSMGADIADLNNDAYPDIYVSEMLPASLERVKTKTLFEDWDKYQTNVRSGYHHQFTRNAFQVNNGPIPGEENLVSFSEISRLTGTEATDWSWGALLFDADNDGLRDIFVANGIYKDLTDQDYVNFYSNNELLISRHKQDSTLLTTLIDKIPSEPLTNFLFVNQGNLVFNEKAISAGLDFRGFSNGAAYADLDNDGDLDLVLNNINDTARIYENRVEDNAYLQLTITGPARNTFGFGTQVLGFHEGNVFYSEHFPVKGYMSSMDPRIHIGLGKIEVLDSILLVWPDGTTTKLNDVTVNQNLSIDYNKSERSPSTGNKHSQTALIRKSTFSNLDSVTHKENDFNDFNRDRLLYEMYSNEGPAAVAGDVNGDELVDFVLGGSRNQHTRLFIQREDGSFSEQGSSLFTDHDRETSDLALFDADNDGDLDLFIAYGSTEFSYLDFRLKDRLYINNGQGSFLASSSFDQLNVTPEPTGFVLPIDFDDDGDQDIITGTRSIPFKYGLPGGLHIYRNEGNGIFIELDHSFHELGLLTSAAAADLNGNGKSEVILAGEWMEPVMLAWNGAGFETREFFSLPAGLYKSLHVADINADGKDDIVFGNYGTNSRLKASATKPLTWYIGDYDENGRLDHLLSLYEGDTLYPLVLLQDLSKQLPVMRKKYQTFNAYKDASTLDLLNGLSRKNESVLTCEELASFVWLNGLDSIVKLPWEAQLSPVYAMASQDITGDGEPELIIGGNQKRVKPELGGYNASYGTVLQVKDNILTTIPHQRSGFWVRGELRELLQMEIGGVPCIIAVRNNEDIEIFELLEK